MFDKLLTQFAAHIPCSKGTPLGEPGRLRRRCGRRATRVARHLRLEIAIAAELAVAPFLRNCFSDRAKYPGLLASERP